MNNISYEERLQWLQYQMDIGDIAQCPRCKKWIAWDEFVNNMELCDDCFYEIAKDDIEKGIL